MLLHCFVKLETDIAEYFTFQQDGALAHKARETVDLLKQMTPDFVYSALFVAAQQSGSVLFRSSAVVDPKVGHIMDVLSPFIPVLSQSD